MYTSEWNLPRRREGEGEKGESRKGEDRPAGGEGRAISIDLQV